MLDKTSRDKMITDNMGLVYFIINRYYPRFNGDDDMVQAGMIGLIGAVDTWDELQAKFSSYASRCILNELKSELRRRNKQIPTVSLDSVVDEYDEGTPLSLMKMVSDTEDIEAKDIRSTERFLDSLGIKDKELLELLESGKTPKEVANTLGCSAQWVYNKRNHLKHKWHKFHDDKQ